MTHYNTTAETGQMRMRFEVAAGKQDAAVLEFFRDFPGEYSPSEIQKNVLPKAPLTSVRRAMSTLTKKGLLEKTDAKRMGPYGRPEYKWRIAS